MVSSELVLVISTHHAGRQVDFLLGLGALQVSHTQLSAWLGNHMQPVSLFFLPMVLWPAQYHDAQENLQ